MNRPNVIETDRTGQVRSVVRALSLLRLIGASENGLTLTEVADRAQVPPSTTHRLLTTLEGERFLRFDPAAGLWQVGVSAFVVGSAFARTRNLIGLAKPYLRRLVDLTGETANLFVESSGHVVCLDQVESRFTMRAITQVGGRVPMHASGSGKAILAFLSAERRDQILGTGPLDKIAKATITDRSAFTQALLELRQTGTAFDDEEHADGLRCVAAPIIGENGQPVAAVSVSGPDTRLTRERLPDIRQHVRRIAGEITAEFGGVRT